MNKKDIFAEMGRRKDEMAKELADFQKGIKPRKSIKMRRRAGQLL